MTVLALSSDPQLRSDLTLALATLGTVVAAGSIAEAQAAIDATAFDVAVLELTGQAGLAELSKHLRAVPVILLARQSPSREALRAACSGEGTDLLCAPFDLGLIAALAETRLLTARTSSEPERGHLYQLLMQAPAAIAVFKGPAHVYELANPAYQRLVNKTGFVGLTVRKAFPEAEGQGLFEIFDRVYTSGEPALIAEMPVRLDRTGTGRGELDEGYYAFNLEPIRNTEGAITGLMAVCVEVTEQVKARRLVEAARRQLNEIFEHVPAIVGVLSGPEQRYILANPGLRALYGNRPLLGRTRREANPELEGQGINEAVDRVFATGQRYSIKELSVRIDRRATGQLEEGIFNIIYEPMLQDGRVHAVVIFAVEVTDEVATRRHAELLQRDLRASEGSLRLLATLSEAVAQTLEQPDVLAAFTRSLIPIFADWAVVDLIADGTVERVQVAHGDPAQAQAAQELKAFVPSPVELERLTSEGVLRIGEWHGTAGPIAQHPMLAQIGTTLSARSGLVVPLEARGRTLGAVIFVLSREDDRLSEADAALGAEVGRRLAAALENARLYREAELERRRAEDASRAKDEFLAVVSHELRTPLTSMLGWVQVLRSDTLTPERQAKALATIERNARSQARLIEDLLDVSQIISGKLRLEVELVDLSTLVESAVESVRPSAAAKDIRLKTTLTSGATIRGDSRRLQQVVWNLLSNAIKFTPRGGSVSVLLERINSSIRVSVTDTGKGIPADFLPHVFERFRQASSGSTRSYGGLGLGLSIVRHVVELHGGTVEATSSGEDQGATVSFRMPASALRNISLPVSEETLDGTPSYECPPELQGMKVLVVDDEQDTRQLLAALLGRCGVIVTTAASVAEAFAQIAADHPDAIVSDVGMPDEDGYRFLERLRSLSAEQGGRIPAVALTAYARPIDRRKALQAGFNMHVPKPIDPAELVVVLASITGRKAT